MKRPLTVLLLGIAACGDAYTEPTAPDVPKPQFAASVETIFKGRFPIGPRTNFNDCTNEWVDIVGEFNLVVRQVTSASGSVHFMIHSVGGHVTGVGQTTGTQYLSNEHFNYTEHTDGPTSILVIEFGISVITKGPAVNPVPGKLQIFVVVNANGEMTVDRFVLDFEC